MCLQMVLHSCLSLFLTPIAPPTSSTFSHRAFSTSTCISPPKASLSLKVYQPTFKAFSLSSSLLDKCLSLSSTQFTSIMILSVLIHFLSPQAFLGIVNIWKIFSLHIYIKVHICLNKYMNFKVHVSTYMYGLLYACILFTTYLFWILDIIWWGNVKFLYIFSFLIYLSIDVTWLYKYLCIS